MVHTIGLLSQGNEEMIHFAWKTFAEFQQFRGDDSISQKIQEHEKFMVKFKQTFCRQGVLIHFIGLFDCVNSVYVAGEAATSIPHMRTLNRVS